MLSCQRGVPYSSSICRTLRTRGPVPALNFSTSPFAQEFGDAVAQCVQYAAEQRPSAEHLLKHKLLQAGSQAPSAPGEAAVEAGARAPRPLRQLRSPRVRQRSRRAPCLLVHLPAAHSGEVTTSRGGSISPIWLYQSPAALLLGGPSSPCDCGNVWRSHKMIFAGLPSMYAAVGQQTDHPSPGMRIDC